ncbi:MAG: 50S ribosomal protein L18 [Gammaproteobacteria bacterium]|nr:50S ribosomal protein L18 [Gammaproteobacteria bacterium]
MRASEKKVSRLRRARKTRAKIRELGYDRLCVFRSPRHIYAQIVDGTGGRVVTSASTLDPSVRGSIKSGGNVEAAKAVGKLIAVNAKAAGVTKVAFDRSGFRFHGRIKALADAARENGLEF